MKPPVVSVIILGVFISSLLPMTTTNPFLIHIQASDIVNTNTRITHVNQVNDYVQLSINIENRFPDFKTVVLAVAFHDARKHLLGTATLTVILHPHQTSIITPPPFTIPQRAHPGDATAIINVYTT